MRMLTWMIGKTRKDRMINDIKDNLRVALIGNKLRENSIIRFGHVYKRLQHALVKRSGSVQRNT